MKKLLIGSVATAALLTGVGFASAQAPKEEHGKALEQQHGQAAPATRGRRPETTGQAPAVPNEPARRVQERREGPANGRNNEPAAGRQTPAVQGRRPETTGQAPALPNEPNGRVQERRQGPANGRNNDPATERQGARPGAETTGQGARTPGGFSAEQRTKMRTTIMHEGVRPAENVNFNVSIGTVIPRTVELHALPSEILVMEPAWRGFMFFLVGDEIVVVAPDSLRIVAVFPA